MMKAIRLARPSLVLGLPLLMLLVTLALVRLLTRSDTSSSEDGETDVRTRECYTSPIAVFDAYREARRKRDARKLFSLLTAEAQNDAVFESFFAYTMQGSEMGPIVSQYVDVATLSDDYEKQYKKRHGIDLAKVRAGRENDPTFVPPPHDSQLWRDAVASHVKDKAGFVEVVAKYFAERAAKQHVEEPVLPLGDLEQLVVQGDTASGYAKMTIVPRPGELPPNPGQSPPIYEKPFKFRRVHGCWWIDSL